MRRCVAPLGLLDEDEGVAEGSSRQMGHLVELYSLKQVSSKQWPQRSRRTGIPSLPMVGEVASKSASYSAEVLGGATNCDEHCELHGRRY